MFLEGKSLAGLKGKNGNEWLQLNGFPFIFLHYTFVQYDLYTFTEGIKGQNKYNRHKGGRDELFTIVWYIITTKDNN